MYTTDEEISEHLVSGLEWCNTTVPLITKPAEIFNSSTYGEFDWILTDERSRITSCCPELDARLSDPSIEQSTSLLRSWVSCLGSLKSQYHVIVADVTRWAIY